MTFDEKVAAQSGRIFSHSFDSLPDEVEFSGGQFTAPTGLFLNSGQTNPVKPILDTSTKASGKNSLKFTIPSESSAGASWQWFYKWSPQFGEGETFYAQYMQRFDEFFFTHTFNGGGGWKQSILGTGGQEATSCSSLEVVVQNTNQRGFPQMYNSCGTFSPLQVGPINGSDFDLQPGMDGTSSDPGDYCSYQSSGSGFPQCFKYRADQWATITQQLTLGTISGGVFQNSNVKLWWSWQGEAAVKVFDVDWDLVASGSEEYGTIWLLPYHTGKDETEVHNETYTWYANVIVATSPIPLTTDDPGGVVRKALLRR